MSENKTPDWLIETQNKSWEPEILISGITLTFIFLLSNHIYNFFGMLVQDFGVFDGVGKHLFRVSILCVSGLKIVLVGHLILRGLWTGLIGLSYVFPDGVNKRNLIQSKKDIEYDRPVEFVIRIEKLCSLIFSFTFTFISIAISFFIFFVPIFFLFVIGLDISLIRLITIALFILLMVFYIVFYKKLAEKMHKKEGSGLLSNTIAVYLTNIGKLKTGLIFVIFLLVSASLSISEISKYRFYNDEGVEIQTKNRIISINHDHYELLRNTSLRIPKATIDRFGIYDNQIELFISNYKEDANAIKAFQKDASLRKENNVMGAPAQIGLDDIYRIKIDGQPLSDLRWYWTEKKETGQKGMMTTIPINQTEIGSHELCIEKIYWDYKKKKMRIIKNWDLIPFEVFRICPGGE